MDMPGGARGGHGQQPPVVLRYVYPGVTPKNGRVVVLPVAHHAGGGCEGVGGGGGDGGGCGREGAGEGEGDGGEGGGGGGGGCGGEGCGGGGVGCVGKGGVGGGEFSTTLSGREVAEALARDGVDLGRWALRYYHKAHEVVTPGYCLSRHLTHL